MYSNLFSIQPAGETTIHLDKIGAISVVVETCVDIIAEVLIALRQVIRATDLHSRQLLKTAGLTAPQLLVLQAIDSAGELSVSTLAAW